MFHWVSSFQLPVLVNYIADMKEVSLSNYVSACVSILGVPIADMRILTSVFLMASSMAGKKSHSRLGIY